MQTRQPANPFVATKVFRISSSLHASLHFCIFEETVRKNKRTHHYRDLYVSDKKSCQVVALKSCLGIIRLGSS